MELLTIVTVLPVCLGFALLVQFGTLKVILWAIELRVEKLGAQMEKVPIILTRLTRRAA